MKSLKLKVVQHCYQGLFVTKNCSGRKSNFAAFLLFTFVNNNFNNIGNDIVFFTIEFCLNFVWFKTGCKSEDLMKTMFFTTGFWTWSRNPRNRLLVLQSSKYFPATGNRWNSVKKIYSTWFNRINLSNRRKRWKLLCGKLRASSKMTHFNIFSA